ncbi:hypothetical protein ACJW30_04G098900 [Castanea mollissima]
MLHSLLPLVHHVLPLLPILHTLAPAPQLFYVGETSRLPPHHFHTRTPLVHCQRNPLGVEKI